MATSNKGKSKGGGNPQTGKLVMAVVCLLAATALLLWNFGVISFGGDSTANVPAVTSEDRKEHAEEAAKQKAKDDRLQNAPPAVRSTAGSQ